MLLQIKTGFPPQGELTVILAGAIFFCASREDEYLIPPKKRRSRRKDLQKMD